MKHFLIKGANNKIITLFFTGWSMDYVPFKENVTLNNDLDIFYDYRDLSIDLSYLTCYDEIRVVGFSMGVWVTSKILENSPFKEKIKKSIAINGTGELINESLGIPPLIYNSTLDSLSSQSLRKFNLRICGTNQAFKSYMENPSQRNDIEELKNELIAMRENFFKFGDTTFEWDEAYIADKDLIFSQENQIRYWKKKKVKITLFEGAHYNPSIIINTIMM